MTEPSEHARRAAEEIVVGPTLFYNHIGDSHKMAFVAQLIQQSIDAATAELKADKARLEKLFAISNQESSESKWRVTLDYDNYQDGARVLDGDGKVVGECYDLDKSPIEQFRAAIDAALHPEQKEKE